MIENLCQAHHCSNTIRGRRKDARYCSESCKQVQKRYNRDNGIAGVSSRRQPTLSKVQNTGSLIDDMSSAAALGLMSNGSIDPINTVTSNVLNACVPYAISSVKNRPFLSLLLAFGGFKAASSYLKSCTTTVTEGKDGKNSTSKSCRPASAIQKTGTAALAVLLGNTLIEKLSNLDLAHLPTIDTNVTRVRPVSDTGNTPLRTKIMVDDVIRNNPDLRFLKAN